MDGSAGVCFHLKSVYQPQGVTVRFTLKRIVYQFGARLSQAIPAPFFADSKEKMVAKSTDPSVIDRVERVVRTAENETAHAWCGRRFEMKMHQTTR